MSESYCFKVFSSSLNSPSWSLIFSVVASSSLLMLWMTDSSPCFSWAAYVWATSKRCLFSDSRSDRISFSEQSCFARSPSSWASNSCKAYWALCELYSFKLLSSSNKRSSSWTYLSCSCFFFSNIWLVSCRLASYYSIDLVWSASYCSKVSNLPSCCAIFTSAASSSLLML